MNSDLDVHLDAIALRSHAAFAAWLAGAEPALWRSLAPYCRAVDAEAVLQESLLRLWQVAPRFVPDGQPNGLLRLAIRIARNLAATEARRHKPVAAPDWALEDQAPQTPHVQPPDEGLRRAIQDCRDRLPEQPRLAIDARLQFSGARDEALAATLGMTPNTFFQNIRRARLALIECLKRRGFQLGLPA